MSALPMPLSKVSTNKSFELYDDHTHPHQGTTLPQLILFVVWVTSVVLWVVGRASRANLLPKLWPVTPGPGAAVETVSAAEDGASTKMLRPSSDGLVAVTVNGEVPTNGGDGRQDGEAGQRAATGSVDQRSTTSNSTSTNSGSGTTTGEVTTKQNFSAIIPPPSTEQFLQQIILLGVIMIYFYLCDYRKVSSIHCCHSRLNCVCLGGGGCGVNSTH